MGMPNVKVDWTRAPVVVKRFLKREDFKAVDRLTDEILNKHTCFIN